ncbi:MAG: DivIVA domain-containing protein [Mycoplasma sp.]
MDYNFEEKINKILDKKFASKIHSGYDPEDVDLFFDDVIGYIRQVYKLQKGINETLATKDKKISELEQLINQQDELIKKMKAELDEYHQEGYSSLKAKTNFYNQDN